jgi:hypothetical protein
MTCRGLNCKAASVCARACVRGRVQVCVCVCVCVGLFVINRGNAPTYKSCIPMQQFIKTYRSIKES